MLFKHTEFRSSIILPCCATLVAMLIGLEPASVLAQEQKPDEKVTRKPAGESPEQSKEVKKESNSDKPVEFSKQSVEEQLERTAEGKIRFSFQGQPWLHVLQWLAKSSKLTLDWQELPADALNLTTQGSFTLDEARDLLNMHLAARGFTLLRRGEVLSLVKLDKLNPALVPRVEAEELPSRDRHEIVRVSFPLDWLVAEEAVKEFEPMKSPFGKLTPMTATNRLEALDTVENLLEIRELLSREQSPHGEERLVVEFKLKHVRAEDIIDKLTTLVGAESNLLRATDRARMQQFMRMRQQQESDKNPKQNPGAQRPERRQAEVHLVVNEQENSVLANAPPDKLAVIRQAVQALDVPSSETDGVRDTVTRMKIYRTKSIDPDALAELIEDLTGMGKLQKSTQVQADDDSNSLIVYATPADHLAIANLVSQVDDDGRDVRIIKLGQLDPNYALQAVKLLLQGDSGGGRRWRGAGNDRFRIEADVERGRLLLWASDEEFDQVQALLAKLADGGQPSDVRGNVRVLSVPADASHQALQNLKRIWPNLRTNPLHIEGLEGSPVRESARQPTPRRSARTQTPAANLTAKAAAGDSANTVAWRQLPIAPPITFAVALAGNDGVSQKRDTKDGEKKAEQPAAKREPANPARRTDKWPSDNEQAPSINITEGPGGRLIITSEDVEALDAVESLIQQIMPKQADYEVFRLKHASPFSVQLTLEQIFAVDEELYASGSGLPATSTQQLRFISDIDTGTLLVQSATAEQLQKIKALIELYDQPESLEAEQQRKTEIYEVKYSHAQAVAEVVKEVYRDLLSSNDKTFTRERKEGESSNRELGYGVNYGSKIPRFKGLLSIGVEEKSNTLVVSAPAFLMADVMQLIRDVDERAANQKVKVVQLNGVGAETLRGVLSQIPGVMTNGGSTRASTGVGAGSGSTPSSSAVAVQARTSRSSRAEGSPWRRLNGDRPRGNDSPRESVTLRRNRD